MAEVWFDKVPHLPAVFDYIAAGCVPGGTGRNYASYASKIGAISEQQKSLLCDPQTSGGLLLAVSPDAIAEVQQVALQHGIDLQAIGELKPQSQDNSVLIEILA
jgi:selenide,water dikinase